MELITILENLLKNQSVNNGGNPASRLNIFHKLFLA